MRVGDRVGRRRAAAPSVVRALVLHAVITLMQVRHYSHSPSLPLLSSFKMTN